MNEDLKQQIRRRTYARRLKFGEPLGDLADAFTVCPECKGRRKVCVESSYDGVAQASLEVCRKYNGDGFVPTTTMK